MSDFEKFKKENKQYLDPYHENEHYIAYNAGMEAGHREENEACAVVVDSYDFTRLYEGDDVAKAIRDRMK